MRCGIGFDAHAFDPDRPLILGGVRIEGSPGLRGHSDADVVSHAIADALLGAAAIGDIGRHFPDTDDRWKDASSIDLLERVASMVGEAGFVVASVDSTLLLEEPKIAPFVDEMRANVAGAIGIESERVGVKATTLEGLGTVGRKEGAACMAVALLVETVEPRRFRRARGITRGYR